MTTTTKVKNGTITLPKQLKKIWQGAEVFITGAKDTILVKRIEKPNFWKTWGKMKKGAKGITKKDIGKAILWARKSNK